MLLEGGLDWKALSLSPHDMDFGAAKAAAARDIALAFGVPPLMLGMPGDNTHANFAEANRALWRQTVIPLINRTLKSFSHWLAPGFGAPLRIDYDVDRIEALAQERAQEWSRIDAASFLSQDEKREAAGYGKAPGVKAGVAAPERRYRPDQARNDHGRWQDKGRSGPAAGAGSAGGSIQGGALTQVAGGIDNNQMGMTVQSFASAFCKGTINRKLPGQFLDTTIPDVFAAANAGDPAATMRLKLLKQDRFRKP